MDLIKKPTEDTDLPPVKPWDERPISLARWRKHRSTMLAHCSPGCRPYEWWHYERQMPPPDRQAEALFEMGELSQAELAKLVPEWRAHYEHGHEPDFAYCVGHAKPGDTFATWIEGDEARARFYDWVGIPVQLIRQWDVCGPESGSTPTTIETTDTEVWAATGSRLRDLLRREGESITSPKMGTRYPC